MKFKVGASEKLDMLKFKNLGIDREKIGNAKKSALEKKRKNNKFILHRRY